MAFIEDNTFSGAESGGEEKMNPQERFVRQFIEGAHAEDKLAALTSLRKQLVDSAARGLHVDMRPETPLDNPNSHSDVRGTEYAGKPAIGFTNNGEVVDPKILLISLFAGVAYIERNDQYTNVPSAYMRTLDVYNQISGIWIPLSEAQRVALICLYVLPSDERQEIFNAMVGYSQDSAITNGLLKNYQVLDLQSLFPSN